MAKVDPEVLARQIERLITDPATLKDDAMVVMARLLPFAKRFLTPIPAGYWFLTPNLPDDTKSPCTYSPLTPIPPCGRSWRKSPRVLNHHHQVSYMPHHTPLWSYIPYSFLYRTGSSLV